MFNTVFLTETHLALVYIQFLQRSKNSRYVNQIVCDWQGLVSSESEQNTSFALKLGKKYLGGSFRLLSCELYL